MADLTLNIISNMGGATAQAKEFTKAMKQAASAVSATGKKVVSTGNAVKSMVSSFSALGKSVKRSTGFFSKFTSSIGRIAFYRAIRSAIRYVTDSFKQGLEAAYNWSKTQGGENAKLAGAMEALSAASGRMKLQLGAAFGGLIVAIEPILTRIINLVTAAADALTRFFAILNGQTQYKKAVSGLDDVGDAASGAGKKVKGLLASWDELNVIGKESGGGGGSNSTDYSGLYEWADAESDWANLFASGNFFGIGAKIGDALGDVAQKITNFLKRPEIQNFGKNLADALNGAVSDPSNWESIGETIGTAIGTATKWICDFFSNVDWSAVKTAIVAFVVGLKVSLVKEMDGAFDYDKPYWQVILDWLLPKNLQPDYENPFSGILEDLNRMWEDTKQGWEDFVSLISTPFKKVKIKIAQYFNDIYINWLEIKQSILDSLNDLPDWITNGLGISSALQDNAEKLVEAKQKAKEYKDELDRLNGKEVNVTITANTENTNVDSWYSRIKQRISQKTASDPISINISPQETSVQNAIHQIEYEIAQAKYIVDIDPNIKNPIDAYALFKNGGNSITSGGAGGGANMLRMPIQIKPELEPGAKVTVPSTANFNDWEIYGTKNPATRGFNKWGSVANFIDWEIYGTKNPATRGFNKWGSVANFIDWEIYGTKNPATRGFNKWGSVANFIDWQVYGTKNPATNGFNMFASVANFVSRKTASTFSTVFNCVANVVANLTNPGSLTQSVKDALAGITVKIKTVANGKTSVFGQLKTSEYAQGGFPTEGELFIAREAGPELVGSIGGSTAVANNDQIVAGIQSGVAQANAEQNELLRQQNSILMQLLNKDLTISPSVALGQVMARSTALYGRA